MQKKLLAILFALFLINPTLVYAQATNSAALPQYNKGVDTSIRDYLCTPSEPPDGHDLERCVNRLYRFGVAVGAIALVFFVVLAGYTYITGGETSKGKAKLMIRNALIGMGLLLGSYILLYFINPSLVTIKTIQPPIFTATLPSCADVGLGEDCVLDTGQATVGNGSGGGQVTPKCTSALVPVKSKNIPVYESIAGSNPMICPDLLNHLVTFNNAMKANNITWGVTSTLSGNHIDPCHKLNTDQTGNCVDLDVPAATANHTLWNKTCQLLKSSGLPGIVNETGVGRDEIPNCGGKLHYDTTSGDSLHVNYTGG